MEVEGLKSISETARQLGVDRAVIAGLVETLGIETHSMIDNNKSKGLTKQAIDQITKTLWPKGKK